MELDDKINIWLRTGKRGASSEAIVTKLTGLNLCKPWEMHVPNNPSDFQRCLKLLIAVPDLRSRLYEMKEISPLWNQIVFHWDELERLYYEEYKGGSCPKLYDRMRELGCYDVELYRNG